MALKRNSSLRRKAGSRLWIETPSPRDREIISPLEVVALEQGYGGSHYPAQMPRRWICSFMDRLTIEVLNRYPAAHAIYSPGSLWGSEGDSNDANSGGASDNQTTGIDHSRRSRAAILFEHGGERTDT